MLAAPWSGSPSSRSSASASAPCPTRSLSYALATKGQDWIFWTVQQTLLFPLLLLAGTLAATAVCAFGLWVGTRSTRAAD